MHKVKPLMIVLIVSILSLSIFVGEIIHTHTVAKNIVEALESDDSTLAYELIVHSNKRTIESRPSAFTTINRMMESSYNYPTFYYICKHRIIMYICNTIT